MARNRTRCVNEKFKEALERAELERFVPEYWEPDALNPNMLVRSGVSFRTEILYLKARIRILEEITRWRTLDSGGTE